MATIIEPTKQDISTPPKRKRYSFKLRLWHWLNLIVICGSWTTVLINSTITDRQATTSLLKTSLSGQGNTVTDEGLRNAAGALEDNVWSVHIYFGYGLAALFVFRLILEIFQFSDQKLLRKIKAAYHQSQETKRQREIARHELTVKLIYAVFYILLAIMVATGLFLIYSDHDDHLRTIRHTVKDIHGFCMYPIIAFIIVHIAGVLLAERKDSPGITSDMINGGSEEQS